MTTLTPVRAKTSRWFYNSLSAGLSKLLLILNRMLHKQGVYSTILTCFMFLLWPTSKTLSCAEQDAMFLIHMAQDVNAFHYYYSMVEQTIWDTVLKNEKKS